jgi:hypothetical protein
MPEVLLSSFRMVASTMLAVALWLFRMVAGWWICVMVSRLPRDIG